MTILLYKPYFVNVSTVHKGERVNNPKNMSTWFMDVPYGGKRSATLVMKLSHYVISSNIILHTPFILTLIPCKDSCKGSREFLYTYLNLFRNVKLKDFWLTFYSVCFTFKIGLYLILRN